MDDKRVPSREWTQEERNNVVVAIVSQITDVPMDTNSMKYLALTISLVVTQSSISLEDNRREILKIANISE